MFSGFSNDNMGRMGQSLGRAALSSRSAGPILVSYSYFEKDDIQRDNFDFFMTIAMGLDNVMDRPRDLEFVIVQSGDECTPCSRLEPRLRTAPARLDSVSSAAVGPNITLLKRKLNEGMDFAAHNTTISYLQSENQLKQYRYIFFLNSSVRGPFVPPYMPEGWQWTDAFTSRLVDSVHAVSSSLVCLPEVDEGGPGPRLESWAFAVTAEGLQALLQEGLFELRTCKLCPDGVVVKGEYGLTVALQEHGMDVDTLMAKYRGVDWTDKRHWSCNNNVHPSRHGTYDGISMHPYETVFLKASWHVGEPFVDVYTRWMLALAKGEPSTGGSFDEPMYRYAITPEAQEPHHVEQCYDVLHRLPEA